MATSLSIFSSESFPPRRRDPYPDDLDRLAASLHALALCRCKPFADETSDHVAVEPMGEYFHG
jgi:hypothetical protein